MTFIDRFDYFINKDTFTIHLLNLHTIKLTCIPVYAIVLVNSIDL